MEITYLGHSSFKIKSKAVTVVTDPFLTKCEADVVTVSHQHDDHNQISKVSGSPFVIDGGGEYEVKGVSVIGVASWHDDQAGALRGPNTIYVIEIEGMRVCHLGDLGHKLSEAQLEEIGSVDIAMIPVGGYYTIDAKMASEVVKQLDPWVVLPMHYAREGSKNLAPLEDFLKEMGKTVEPQPKLVISRDKLPEETQVVWLK